MKHFIYSLFITLAIFPYSMAEDKTIAQQLEEAKKEKDHKEHLCDERRREIGQTQRNIQRELGLQALDKEGRQKILAANARRDNTTLENQKLEHSIQNKREDANQYALYTRSLQHSVDRMAHQANEAKTDLERKHRDQLSIQTRLSHALHEVETLRANTRYEKQEFAKLQYRTKIEYGSAKLQAEQQQLSANIKESSTKNDALSAHTATTENAIAEQQKAFAFLHYNNEKLAERLKQRMPEKIPDEVVELAHIFKDMNYKEADEAKILAQHPGREDELRKIAYAYLVLQQDYLAAGKAALAIEESKKGFVERHKKPTCGGLIIIGILAGIICRLCTQNRN